MEIKPLCMLHKDKKGVAGMDILKSVVISIFVLGLLLAIFAIMNSELKKSVTNTSTEYGIIANTTLAIASIPGWFTLIITITIMVVLIFLVSMIIRAVKGSGVESA